MKDKRDSNEMETRDSNSPFFLSLCFSTFLSHVCFLFYSESNVFKLKFKYVQLLEHFSFTITFLESFPKAIINASIYLPSSLSFSLLSLSLYKYFFLFLFSSFVFYVPFMKLDWICTLIFAMIYYFNMFIIIAYLKECSLTPK